MSRFSQGSRCAVVVPCLLAALALLCATPARGQIFLQLGQIAGDAGMSGTVRDDAFAQRRQWIRLTSVQIAGQTVLASAPWHITPPPGVQSITATKNTDVSSPGLSAAFASKTVFPDATIDLITLGADGSVRQVDRYALHGVVVSSFVTTPPTETLTLSFTNIGNAPLPPERSGPRTFPASSRRPRLPGTPTP